MVEALSVGLVVSLLASELIGLYTGGMITPAYLALLTNQPWRVLGTLIAAGLTFGAYRILATQVILYGRRRFIAMILLGVLAKWIVQSASPALAATLAVPVGTIGFILPGLIANDFERQGILSTLAMLAVATVLAALTVRVLGL